MSNPTDSGRAKELLERLAAGPAILVRYTAKDLADFIEMLRGFLDAAQIQYAWHVLQIEKHSPDTVPGDALDEAEERFPPMELSEPGAPEESARPAKRKRAPGHDEYVAAVAKAIAAYRQARDVAALRLEYFEDDIERGPTAVDIYSTVHAVTVAWCATTALDLSVRSAPIPTTWIDHTRARGAAVKRHGKPGGSSEMRKHMLAAWATGRYRTRDECADKECDPEREGWSREACRKALRGAPKPAAKRAAAP